MLAITFTNKAALEMKERLSRLLSDTEERIFAGTFHSFLPEILQQYGTAVNLPRDFGSLHQRKLKHSLNSLAETSQRPQNILEKPLEGG